MNYSMMKKDELKAICKEHNIKGITGKNKDQLIEMLKQRLVTSVSAPKIDAETDVKESPSVKAEMIWIPWSEKSKDIPFKSSIVGVGDGEQKVACELDTQPLGQNSPYDMMPTLNGVITKCDVKKLDTQDDFNTGKEGRDVLRPYKNSLSILLDSLNSIASSEIFTSDERKDLSWFHDVSPDELAVGTLKKLKKTCAMLSHKKKNLRSTLPSVELTVNSQTNKMPIDLYYTICQNLGLVFPSEFSSFVDTIQILQQMNHTYIDSPEKIDNDLDSLVGKLFTDIKVIIVDKNKGYMFLKEISKIHFYRITRGHPRFQVIF